MIQKQLWTDTKLEMEQAEHLQRHKEVWERIRAAKDVSVQVAQKPHGGRPNEFSSDTEATVGMKQNAVNRATRHATEVHQEATSIRN